MQRNLAGFNLYSYDLERAMSELTCEEAAQALANTTLTMLDLNGNDIGHEMGIALAKTTNLTSLDVSYNNMVEGSNSLAAALAANTTLKTLDISTLTNVRAEGNDALNETKPVTRENSENILVNLPSGKLSKQGKRVPLRGQKGMTCILYGMRRIAFFDQPDPNLPAIKAYKKIKQAMTNFKSNYAQLVQVGLNLCKEANIDLEQSLKLNNSFMRAYKNCKAKRLSEIDFFNKIKPREQWTLLYNILIEKIVLPLMHIKNVNWHPRDGFAGLGESLKKYGAHAFLGKFGSYCHTKKPVAFKEESTANRHVYFFEKNTFKGDSIPFTHCVIVDQVKVVGGKQMVFFRDPNWPSTNNKPEEIFMLSYENFVQRLTNWQGERFADNKCSDTATFSRVSTCPEKFGHKI